MDIQLPGSFESFARRDTETKEHLTKCGHIESWLRHTGSLYRASCGNLPGYFHLVVTRPNHFIEQAGDGAAVIGDDRYPLADLRSPRAGRKIDVSMFLGKLVDPGIRIFTDVTIAVQTV
jgi:hypothetical protein